MAGLFLIMRGALIQRCNNEGVWSIQGRQIRSLRPRLEPPPIGSRCDQSRQIQNQGFGSRCDQSRQIQNQGFRFKWSRSNLRHPRSDQRQLHPNRNVASQSNLRRRCMIQRSEDPAVHPPRPRRPQLPSNGGHYRRTGARVQASQTGD
jgi:hypothetical protein